MSLSSKHSVLQPFTPINSSKKSPTYSQARRASIKDEADTKWSVPRELAASVAQSLNQYETRTMQRQHNKDIAEVIARNPIFRGIPTTSVPPILQECPTTSLGVPLYISPSPNIVYLQSRIPVELSVKLYDNHLGRYALFGTEEMRRVMVLGIFKFLLWQCGEIANLAEVATTAVEIEWLHFPQRLWDRGFNLVNLPPKALYPNGQQHTHPLLLPIEVIDEIIIQFAHDDVSKRFGLVNAAHDMVNPKPFMSKVTKSNGLQPVEWSIAGMNSPKLERFIQESPDGRCRCNNCVDALFGSNLQLGLQLVRDMEAPDLSSRVVTSWIANWTEKKLIFSLTDKLLAAVGENSACDASTHTAPDTSVIGQVENEVTPAQEESSSFCSNHETASANLTFEESTNFVGIPFRDISLGEETDEQSDYEDRDISADDTSFEGSMLSQASQHSQIPGSIDYDTVPSIVQAELEWDLEDIRTDRERWEHDERIKRQREDEDRKQETDRKKRRLVLANEAQTALIEAWRADEDRRRQEERERQDTLMRERFRAKLAEVE